MIKKKLFSTSFVFFFSVLTLLFTGCNDSVEGNRQTKSLKHIGYFMNFFDDDIKYECDEKMHAFGEKGRFSCKTFPIAFYIDSEKVGEVYSLHTDGYVFPQDIIRVYKQDKSMRMASR